MRIIITSINGNVGAIADYGKTEPYVAANCEPEEVLTIISFEDVITKRTAGILDAIGKISADFEIGLDEILCRVAYATAVEIRKRELGTFITQAD